MKYNVPQRCLCVCMYINNHPFPCVKIWEGNSIGIQVTVNAGCVYCRVGRVQGVKSNVCHLSIRREELDKTLFSKEWIVKPINQYGAFGKFLPWRCRWNMYFEKWSVKGNKWIFLKSVKERKDINETAKNLHQLPTESWGAPLKSRGNDQRDEHNGTVD